LSLRQLKSYCRSRGNPSATGEYIRSISLPPVKTCAGAMTGSDCRQPPKLDCDSTATSLGHPQGGRGESSEPIAHGIGCSSLTNRVA